MEKASKYFETNIHTTFVEDITNIVQFEGLRYAMFKSICFDDRDKENYYYAERINICGKNGLKLGIKNSNEYRLLGFDIEAEDPRIICFQNKIYVIFVSLSIYPNIERGIAITEFHHWNPIYLKIRDIPQNIVEKNWVPFIKNNEFYFLYNQDPLIILKYDFNQEGNCDIIYRQNDVSLPLDTGLNILRGGSNLLPYKNNLYIGASHDRIILGIYVFFFTRIIILDVDNWKIKYVSKPIAYKYPYDDLQKLPNTDIIWQYHEDVNYHNNIRIMLQYPSSLNYNHESNTFYLTTYFLEKRTLLYELRIDNIDMFSSNDLEIGELQQKITNEMLELINYSFTVVNPQT